MPPIIDKGKCNGCGTCADICPTQVFRHKPKEDKVPAILFGDECWHCNSCVLDCPKQAVSLRLPMPYMLLHVDAKSLSGS